MKDTIITRHVTVNAPKTVVWDALADFGNVCRLSPNIKKSYLTSDLKRGLGASRHCDLAAMGVHVEERVVEWTEGRSLKVDMYETNMPMVSGMNAAFLLEEAGNSTVITGTMAYKTESAIGNLVNGMVMKKMNEKAWEKFLAGIKHNIETGEEVNADTKLDLRPVKP